jgi:hypothetical protein
MTTQTENHEEEAANSGETPAQYFKRIANPRLAKCQTAIRALGKCSSNSYEYTDAQIEIIAQILQKEVNDCINRFNGIDENSDLL